MVRTLTRLLLHVLCRIAVQATVITQLVVSLEGKLVHSAFFFFSLLALCSRQRQPQCNTHALTCATTLHQTQHSTAQHSTAQHSAAQRSAAQRSTAQHSTAQHSTAQQGLTLQRGTAFSLEQATACSNELHHTDHEGVCACW